MAQDGAVFLRPLSATADAPGGEPSLAALTISAGASGGEPSLVAATATGEGFAGSTSASGYAARLAALRSTGTASAGSVAEGDGDLAPLTADALGSLPHADVSLAAMTASGTSLTGGVSSASLSLLPLTAAAVATAEGVASASLSLRPLTSTGLSLPTVVAVGAASLRAMAASASSLNGGAATGAPSFAPLEAAGTNQPTVVASGSPRMLPMSATGAASAALAETYRTWAINLANNGLTEYQNFDFNSYAEFDGRFFAAGPSGVFELGGTTDDGADIDWVLATGFMDGTNGGRRQRGGLSAAQARQKKRLEEVLFAARASGPMLLRVWTDDVTYNDYTVESHRPDVVYQFRRIIGKGALSRFYKIELRGVDNTAVEIATMQLPFIPVARRLG